MFQSITWFIMMRKMFNFSSCMNLIMALLILAPHPWSLSRQNQEIWGLISYKNSKSFFALPLWPVKKNISFYFFDLWLTNFECFIFFLHNTGRVYNMTPYLEYHPGGIPEIMRGVGRDATDLFDEVNTLYSPLPPPPTSRMSSVPKWNEQNSMHTIMCEACYLFDP